MSNRKRSQREKDEYSLEKYVRDAKGTPFVLRVSADRTIEVPRPTGDQMMEVETARTSKEIIEVLCGEQADEILELVGPKDFAVMAKLGEDMQEHFGLGESGG